MMTTRDEFGQDPGVKYMRRVFAEMEKAQALFMKKLGISPHDNRLRRIREASLEMFERRSALAGRRGILEMEKDIATLYVYCLAQVLSANRIRVPDEELPVHDVITHFMKETLK